MDIPGLLRSAQDPTLIAGVYNTCDQWCAYCPLTERCLLYRCEPQSNGGSPGGDVSARMSEALVLLRVFGESERPPSREAPALSRPPLAEIDVSQDPLAQLADDYRRRSSDYLRAHPGFSFEMTRRETGPTPFEIVAWHHTLIASKVFRALFSAALGADDPSPASDALASAKVALIGIDRSLDALTVLPLDGDDPRLPFLRALLVRLRRDLERRFPTARAFVRPGFD
jgi:hypothetical protein